MKAGPNPADYYLRVGGSPGAGAHTYKVNLEASTGKWTATYDGSTWEGSTFAHDGWKNETGDIVQYVGEIYVKESDMVGTEANKCQFTSCQYRLKGGAFANAGLVAGNLHSTDRKEWDYEYASGTAFNIWDVKPLS